MSRIFGLSFLTVLCSALLNVQEQKTSDRKFVIAYFRHSIKATGTPTLGSLNQDDNDLLGRSDLMRDCLSDPGGDDCKKHMQVEFEAYDGHLAGLGKEVCPRNVGKMLRTFLGGKPTYQLWSGSYPRVMGTGIQTAAGFAEKTFIAAKDMPVTQWQLRKTSRTKMGPLLQVWDAKNPHKDYASTFLSEKETEAGGQRTGWLKEYLHDYSSKSCPEGWGVAESGGCELSVYSATKPQKPEWCIGAHDPIQKPKAWSKKMLDIYIRTDKDLIKGLTKIADSPGLFPFLHSFAPGECPDVPNNPRKYTYQDAEQICKLGQHVFNERTSAIVKADYMQIIPSCANVDERDAQGSDCDKIIDMLNDMCWPFFAKSHLVGDAYRFVDNSVALLIGALSLRAGLLDTPDKLKAYKKLRKNAVSQNNDHSIPEPSKSLEENIEHPSDAVLMSSHDATTNGVRLVMIDAGLQPIAPVREWYDGSDMAFDDELAYQVMLTFSIEGAQLTVKNLVQSLYQTRTGCTGLDFATMPTIGQWPVKEFIATMASHLLDRNEDGSGFVDPAVKPFLESLKGHSAPDAAA